MSQLTDILIPLGTGSRHDNLELGMCLRSIEKHLKGVGDIYIVGDCPEWLSGLIKLHCKDNPNSWNRAHNIYRKIMTGLSFVSDNFLFMNDDHYLLTDYDLNNGFPFYHRGALDPHKFAMNQPQFIQMSNTAQAASGNDYDIHCPIIYNKGLFRYAFEGVTWSEHGYGIKSYYSNIIDVRGTGPVEDLKFAQPMDKKSIYRALEGRQWFSIGDRCLRSGAMKEVLQELYPNKSIYEL